MKFIDITGKRFNRLTAIKHVYASHWIFKCDCGVVKEMHSAGIRAGRTKSCGCLKLERCKTGTNALKHGDVNTLKEHHTLYVVWARMLQRCNNTKDAAYKNYGGRGIQVCLAWKNSYLTFKEWALKSGWQKGLTLDRKNNDGSYTPINCRWATRKEQTRNRRTTVFITHNGETKPLAEWAEITGIRYATLSWRYRHYPTDLEKVFKIKRAL